MTKKPINWLIIDENNRIIDKFRLYSIVLKNIRRLGHIHIGSKLKIISIEDYEELIKNPENQPKHKLKIPQRRDEGRWTW